uniref:Uncharacterized protein n=1 Tax=Eutreptiella gymnastica TaxID=73025 RepID=A0A7S4FTK9_9EUGL
MSCLCTRALQNNKGPRQGSVANCWWAMGTSSPMMIVRNSSRVPVPKDFDVDVSHWHAVLGRTWAVHPSGQLPTSTLVKCALVVSVICLALMWYCKKKRQNDSLMQDYLLRNPSLQGLC